jgi:DNA polymerase-3 subunit epsilon
MSKPLTILDTETTGLDPESGHRIIEIAAIKTIDLNPVDRFHVYVNPLRDVPQDSVAIHGITTEFLRDKPVFEDIVESFWEFVKDTTLVIHNSEFDLKFLNHELRIVEMPTLEGFEVIDTLQMAREKFPGSPATLDALARRFRLTNRREAVDGRHGALIDCEMLFDIYVELTGGRQGALDLDIVAADRAAAVAGPKILPSGRRPIVIRATEAELERHAVFLEKAVKDPIWRAA